MFMSLLRVDIVSRHFHMEDVMKAELPCVFCIEYKVTLYNMYYNVKFEFDVILYSKTPYVNVFELI